MSTIKCDIYRITFEKKDSLDVLAQIKLSNLFEPIEPLFEYKDESLKSNLSLEKENYNETKKALLFLSENGFENINKKIHVKDLKKNFSEKRLSELKEIVREILEFKSENQSILDKKLNIQKQVNLISPIKDSTLKVSDEGELFNTKLLKMNVNTFEEIKYDLRENDLINVEEIHTVDKEKYVIVIFDKVTDTLVNQIIQNKKIDQIEISSTKPIRISDFYKNLQSELVQIDKDLEKVKENLKGLVGDDLNDIKSLADIQKLTIESLELSKYLGYSFGKGYDHLSSELDAIDLKKALDENSLVKSHIEGSSMLHIDGWINPESKDEFEKSIKKVSKNIDIVMLDRDKLSDSRSGVKNVRFFQPFETITTLMGTPSSSEIDPSPYVAPFFIAFFGFALGDAGYGIIITLATIYALTKMDLDRNSRNGVTLMLYCGLSTIFFGALTGGWFGANLDAIGPLGEFLASFKLFDIASNIILVLIASLTIGFIHQIFGLGLSMYSHIKNGDVSGAIWKPGTWILFLLTIVAFALKGFSPILSNLPWNIILILVTLIFSWGQGSGTKNPLLRPVKGLTAIFGITSFLSNTLSYARLLALALATGVIASVVNLLATLFSGDIPVVSFIIASLILVLGHAFNLILNLVGTFINVVRLHLVEFFPHFFEAQGVAIQPLKFDSDYIIIDDSSLALDFVQN